MSIIRADSIKNRAGDGAPDFPNGITVTGIVTATTLNQNITGLSTFNGNIDLNGDLDVSGNISIGGTLTYEDVTNIDSVGLITARNGISVSSGGLKVLAGGSNFNDTITGTATTATTITVSSDTTDTLCFPIFANTGVGNNAPKVNTNKLHFNSSSGQLTATSFSGSGANLTSLPAANLTGTLPAIDGSNLTGIDASAITTGTTKVQTNATSIVNQISGSGIATITAQGLNVTGIVTATSMKVFSSGIDYEWQGGTSMAWWKSEDIVSTSSWPAAKGGSDANLISHNGGTSGLTYTASDSSFNNHKTIQMSGNAGGGLRTTNQDVGYWWNGSDAWTMIMALRKNGHNGSGSYGDAAFVMNVNSGAATQSWAMDIFGDHSWGGGYGEMWGGIRDDYEGLESMFSYPWRGLFMVRMDANYDFGEISVNAGSGWKRLEMRHDGPSSLGTTFREMSIFTNCAGNSGHSFDGRIAEWAYWRNKRLAGVELECVTRHWCEKFQL